MGHLMSSMKPGPDDDVIDPIGVGTVVEYHGRAGSMRQGRTTFPAMVLRQHPDDGSLDMLVFFEAEDILWEQRVMPWTEQRPDRCWSPLADTPIEKQLQELKAKVFGDFHEPDKAVMSYLEEFDDRLRLLEKAVQDMQHKARLPAAKKG